MLEEGKRYRIDAQNTMVYVGRSDLGAYCFDDYDGDGRYASTYIRGLGNVYPFGSAINFTPVPENKQIQLNF